VQSHISINMSYLMEATLATGIYSGFMGLFLGIIDFVQIYAIV